MGHGCVCVLCVLCVGTGIVRVCVVWCESCGCFVCVCVSVCVCVARVHGLFVRCVVVLCVRVELCVFVPLGPEHQGPECIWARFWIAWVTFWNNLLP